MPIILPASAYPRDHLVIPDPHAYPDDDFRRFKWLGEYIMDTKPEVIVNIGDMWEMGSLCVAPSTLILKADMTWVEAGSLNIDDEIIGFKEGEGKGSGVGKSFRKFKKGFVTQNTRFISPKGYKVTTTHGEVICSHDHMFMSYNIKNVKGAVKKFRTGNELKVGYRIVSLGAPWHDIACPLTDKEIGYLQGFLDGEGYYGNGRLSWSQNDGFVADYVLSLFTKLQTNVEFYTEADRPKLKHYYIKGSYLESWRLLQLIRPVRLLPKLLNDIDGKTCSKFSGVKDAEILSIEPLKDITVIGLETTVGTYISNSLFSHNCSYDKGKRDYVYKNVRDDIESGHTAEALMFGPLLKFNEAQAKNKKRQYRPSYIKLMGNHEFRVKRLLDLEPKWDGSVSMESFRTRLDLDEIIIPYLDFIIVDDIAYSHVFVSGTQGRPYSSARAMLMKKGMSCTMGHTHLLDHAHMTKPTGDMCRALIAGSFHDPKHASFAGAQADNFWWNGILHKRQVFKGSYDLEEISIKRLERMYEPQKQLDLVVA